jgi:TonB family protein
MGALILLGLIVVVVGGVIFMHSETGGAQSSQVTAPAPIATAPQPQVAQPEKPAPTPEPKATTPAKQESATHPQLPATQEAKPEAPPPAESAPPDAAPATASVTPVSGILSQPLPDIMDKARSTIHGRVRLNIRVDVAPNGSVTNAKIESGSSKYFGERALAAVREWKFEPATVNGSEVAQRWRVRFEFQKSGTKVQPQRVSP